jgi:hypothetical protein
MNKFIIMSIFLITIPLLQMPAVSAWNWNTHQEIVESNYYSLPSDIQKNLNLEVMKKGSNDPDFAFFDFKYHSYPNSYQKASYWLNKGQKYYTNGDYYDASYCYGAASHYITDSFSAPHAACVSGPNHNIYEIKASFLKPESVKITGDLNSTMYNGDLNGEKSWNSWIKSKDNSLIQNDLNHATGASYNAVYSSLIKAHPAKKSKATTDTELRFFNALTQINLVIYS